MIDMMIEYKLSLIHHKLYLHMVNKYINKSRNENL